MLNLIFDFDGVIGDTFKAAAYGLIKTGREKDEESASAHVYSYASKMPHHTNNHTLSDTELAGEYSWTASFGEHVHEHGFDLFDDFVREIENIETDNKAIVSSGSQKYVLPALMKTNIKPTHILAFEDHHSKEEKIEMICKDWGVATNEVYYITDSLADIFELKNFISPDKLIGVTWGFCTKEQLLTELDSKQILDAPEHIRKLLD